MSEDEALVGLFDVLRTGDHGSGRTRVQATVSDSSGTSEVVLYRRPIGPFVRFVRAASIGPARSVNERAIALITSQPQPSPTASEDVASDVLICTHGKRDICCGSLGPSVHRDLESWCVRADQHRARRTSHLGGHRFAPTALVMPSGTAWAWADADLLTAILDRSATANEVAGHYRGSIAFDSPEAQVAERALLAEHGWEWLDWPRRCVGVARAKGGAVVEFEYSPDGSWRRALVRAESAGELPVPNCGVLLDGTEKRQEQFTTAIMSDSAVELGERSNQG